jgi:hypothetical protein
MMTVQARLTVANQIFSLRFDGAGCASGTLVRLNDGLEASFSSPECLLHLLEGVVGRRLWQANREQVVAELLALRECA